MADDDGGTLIEFPKGKPPRVQRKAGTRRGTCSHRLVWLDEEKRQLECRSCGHAVDAFEWLGVLAREGDALVSERREVKELREQIYELEQTEKKIKARLKRARLKLPAQTPTVQALRKLLEHARRLRYDKRAQELVAAVDALDGAAE